MSRYYAHIEADDLPRLVSAGARCALAPVVYVALRTWCVRGSETVRPTRQEIAERMGLDWKKSTEERLRRAVGALVDEGLIRRSGRSMWFTSEPPRIVGVSDPTTPTDRGGKPPHIVGVLPPRIVGVKPPRIVGVNPHTSWGSGNHETYSQADARPPTHTQEYSKNNSTHSGASERARESFSVEEDEDREPHLRALGIRSQKVRALFAGLSVYTLRKCLRQVQWWQALPASERRRRKIRDGGEVGILAHRLDAGGLLFDKDFDERDVKPEKVAIDRPARKRPTPIGDAIERVTPRQCGDLAQHVRSIAKGDWGSVKGRSEKNHGRSTPK